MKLVSIIIITNILFGVMLMNLSPLYSRTLTQNDSKDNYYKYNFHTFRYQSLVFLWPTVSGEIASTTPITIRASKVFADKFKGKSTDVAVIDPNGAPLPDYSKPEHH
ncbi:MAG: hypothetical protein ACYC0V_15400 [Armatimonadota bacterium]